MSKKGFTLIELMIVIAIISIMAAVVTPRIFPMSGPKFRITLMGNDGSIIRDYRNCTQINESSWNTCIYFYYQKHRIEISKSMAYTSVPEDNQNAKHREALPPDDEGRVSIK